LADGPDEVHLQQLGKNENKRGAAVTKQIKDQAETTKKMFAQYNISLSEPGPQSKL